MFITILTSCTYTDTSEQESETVKDVGQIVRIESADEFFGIDNGIVYFARENCAYCNSFFPILEEISCTENIMVSYFDTGYFRDNSLLAESELQTIFADYQVFSVPMVLAIRNGQLHDSFSPNFNDQRDNTTEVKDGIQAFLAQDF
jgi:thiol-disulfide isomerase/thioredoxin